VQPTRWNPQRTRRRALAALGTAATLAAAVWLGHRSDAADAAAAAPQDSPRLTPLVLAVRKVAPSVVSVNVIRRERVAASPLDRFFAPFVPFGYEREVAGIGSGFAVARGGYVLTNAHVVRGAVEIVVTTAEGRDLPARLVGADELADVALLRVDGEIPVPEFGDSQNLIVGEPVIAIGNPFGYLLANAEPTVTTGVISGVGRNIVPYAFADDAEGEPPLYAGMIQTDASINPGNSGGPLVNALGQVIGVNSSIFSPSGGSVGLGFAIPIHRALRIADELRRHGHVRRGWVGIDVAPSERGPGGRVRGAVVARVAQNSPADRAGLRPGDRLVAVDGRPVKSPLDWEGELLDLRVGDRVTLAVERDGRRRDLAVVVEDLPSVRAPRVAVLEGWELVTLTPAIRAEREIRSRRGALVVRIPPQVTAATGLRPGDCIVQVNRWPVETAEEAAEALRYAARRGAVRVVYERGGTLWSTTFYF
jgi:serine protease Do